MFNKFFRQGNIVEFHRELSLGGMPLSYKLRKSHSAKSMRVSVRWGGTIEVTVPFGASDSLVEDFLLSKRTWIIEKLAFYKNAPKGGFEVILSENKLRFLGKDYPLSIVCTSSTERVVLGDDNAILYLCEDSIDAKRRLLVKWYHRQAKKLIGEKVAKLLQKNQLDSSRRMSIKNHKSLWGSCSSRGNLNFNWRLTLAPEIVLDYIIAHEVAHLSELNHSKKFWALVEEMAPHYRECEQWLKLNGSYLSF